VSKPLFYRQKMNYSSFEGPLLELVIPGQSKREDFAIMPKRCALLLIDIQEYLSIPTNEIEKQSYFFQESLPLVLQNIAKLLPIFRSLRDFQTQGCEVVFTYLEALTKDCRDISLDYKLSGPKLTNIPDIATNPAKFLPQISPSYKGKGDIRIPKTSCSVFTSTNLRYVLQNLKVEQLVVVGQLTNQCVESAVRDAADLGFFVTVVEDACAAMSLDAQNKGLDGMRGFCRILKTQDVILELSN